MWGLPALFDDVGIQRRFIPTYVGLTVCKRKHGRDRAVHPHVCGAYSSTTFFKYCVRGSSPRMWGLRQRCQQELAKARFIPTYVGLTVNFLNQFQAGTVHPHVCGAYDLNLRAMRCRLGSSPRMWGLRLMPPCLPSASSVHPHVCGAYANRTISPPGIFGSSPRMWGLRRVD